MKELYKKHYLAEEDWGQERESVASVLLVNLVMNMYVMMF